jgi:hypothetical protein
VYNGLQELRRLRLAVTHGSYGIEKVLRLGRGNVWLEVNCVQSSRDLQNGMTNVHPAG